MKIEGNQKELDAMVEFHKGNRVEGLRLQEEFAAEFRKEHTFSACKFFSGYKPLPLSSKVQKKTIYDFTVNDLFIVNIQFISFCFHNLATHGKCHPHIQHHLLFCTA